LYVSGLKPIFFIACSIGIKSSSFGIKHHSSTINSNDKCSYGWTW
jgi:hypothetical protein